MYTHIFKQPADAAPAPCTTRATAAAVPLLPGNCDLLMLLRGLDHLRPDAASLDHAEAMRRDFEAMVRQGAR